jgi:hypothetical protein
MTGNSFESSCEYFRDISCIGTKLRVCIVLKVASNCSTTNDCFGAIAAVAETQEDFRFVPLRGIQEREEIGLDTPVNGCPIPLDFRKGVFILLMHPL